MKAQGVYKTIEIARLLQIHPMTCYRMMKRGEIPAVKKIGQWWMRKDAFHEWLDRLANGSDSLS